MARGQRAGCTPTVADIPWPTARSPPAG